MNNATWKIVIGILLVVVLIAAVVVLVVTTLSEKPEDQDKNPGGLNDPTHNVDDEPGKNPDDPVTDPNNPDDPNNPNNPVTPSGPDDPNNPVTPSGPDDPNNPITPSGPDDPNNPSDTTIQAKEGQLGTYYGNKWKKCSYEDEIKAYAFTVKVDEEVPIQIKLTPEGATEKPVIANSNEDAVSLVEASADTSGRTFYVRGMKGGENATITFTYGQFTIKLVVRVKK